MTIGKMTISIALELAYAFYSDHSVLYFEGLR